MQLAALTGRMRRTSSIAKKVIAVDNSEKMAAFGANKAKKNGLKNLEFRLGDLENPPIDAQSVDLVILSQALHHAADPEQTLQSAYKILKPGGQLWLLDLMKHLAGVKKRRQKPEARSQTDGSMTP